MPRIIAFGTTRTLTCGKGDEEGKKILDALHDYFSEGRQIYRGEIEDLFSSYEESNLDFARIEAAFRHCTYKSSSPPKRKGREIILEFEMVTEQDKAAPHVQ